MVLVHVWSFRGKNEAWGHASMAIGSDYVSWWPEPNGRTPSKLHGNIYHAPAFRYRTYNDDVRDERQRPDHTIALNGLDENAIKDWWQSFGMMRDGMPYLGPRQSWQTLKRNCSTVVATGLTIGGGSQYVRFLKPLGFPWTPNDVLSYAMSIQSGLGAKSR